MTAAIHNLEAEQALLGAVLFNNSLLEQLDGLEPPHFYDPVHGRLFEAARKLITAGAVADGVRLKEWARTDPGMIELGGASYLMKVMECAAPLTPQVLSYADLIRDLALRRRIVETSRAAIDAATALPDGLNGEDVLLDAQRALAELGELEATGHETWHPAGAIALKAVENAMQGQAKGISTGLPKLDECTSGGRPGALWVLGGATSMGKSVGGQQIAINVARQGYGVAYIHLEMGADEVGLRLASALAWDSKRIDAVGDAANPPYLSAANNALHPAQWQRMHHAARALAPELPIYIDDRPGRTVAQIEAAVRRLFLRMKRDGITPGLLVIDHEGLITPDQKYPSQLEAASARAKGLKDMVKRFGVWGLVLSQITKEGSRADGDERLPQSTDLNYGSALSQAAHVVILLHRKAYYAERKPHTTRTAEDIRIAGSRECTLVVDKARGGRRAHVQAIMDVASAVLIEQE